MTTPDQAMKEPMIWLRDRQTLEWIRIDPGEWVSYVYQQKVDEAMEMFRATLGGVFILDGTPEQGQLAVYDKEHKLLTWIDWCTMT